MQLAHSTQHRLLGQNVVQRTAQIECNRTNNSQPGTAKSFKKNAREPTKVRDGEQLNTKSSNVYVIPVAIIINR